MKGSRKSVARKSVARKSVARKSTARKSTIKFGKSSIRRISVRSRAKKFQMGEIMDHLNTPTNMDIYYNFVKELLKKKEDIVKDCKDGRKRFVDWLAMFLRAEGLMVETRTTSANPLSIYGPEGPPSVILAYPVKPDPSLSTLCIFGRFEQVEQEFQDPALLFNGRICYRKRPPETWSVLACWLATLKALSIPRQQLPVNIQVCFTAFQAEDASAMIKFINSIKGDFLRCVDFIVYATTLGITTLPGGVAYSGRGVCDYILEISDENPANENCPDTIGLLSQVGGEVVEFLYNLRKDCVYSHLNMFEDFVVPHRFLKLVRRVYVRDLAPIKGFFNRKKILEIKEKRALEMWKPEVSVQEVEGFSQYENEPPNKVVVRFSVKYMTEASPAQIEDMVNRMLYKKFFSREPHFKCHLSMNYWSRPWYAHSKNRLYRPIKKAAAAAFHKCPTEALDFAPNSLPAILQRLITEDFCMIILASMPDMRFHRYKKNLKRNMKMLCTFFYELQLIDTARGFSKKWNACRTKTRPYRIRHKKVEKRWHPPIDPDHPEVWPPLPVLSPEELENTVNKKTSHNEQLSTNQTKKSTVRKSKVGRKSAARKSVAKKSKAK